MLTKVDIAGPARADAWTRYLQHRFPGLRVVQVESYAEKTTAEASGARKAYEPHLPSAFRQTLVDALRDTHAELLELPERIRDVPEKAAAWKPPVKREVDWEAVLHARGGKVGHAVGGVAVPRPSDAVSGDPSEPVSMKEGPEEDEDDDVEPEFLTIGLIGMSEQLLTRLLYITPAVQDNLMLENHLCSMHCLASRKLEPLRLLARYGT